MTQAWAFKFKCRCFVTECGECDSDNWSDPDLAAVAEMQLADPLLVPMLEYINSLNTNLWGASISH